MFGEEWVPDASDIRSIRSIGHSKAGETLSRYIEQEVSGAVSKAMSADATDATTIAYAQAFRNVGTRIWQLLNFDIDALLEMHNIESEVEDETGNQSE